MARTTLLEEVAKFRAARRIWARVMREDFGARDPKSQALRFHTQTAGVQLTAQQPEVNLVRVALQGLGAVLGGTQSLHTNAFDEAIALPTAKAARLALRTQQVIAYESDVTKTVDPFAGSYVMESLTDDLEEAILELMATVEAKGGAVAAIEEGYQKSEIERSAYAVNQQIDSGERTVVGLNRFRLEEEDAYEPLRVDPQIEADQRERLARPCGPAATTAPSSARSTTSARRPRAPTTRCRRCVTPSRPRPPSARCATRCATCGGPTSHAIPSDHCAHDLTPDRRPAPRPPCAPSSPT